MNMYVLLHILSFRCYKKHEICLFEFNVIKATAKATYDVSHFQFVFIN